MFMIIHDYNENYDYGLTMTIVIKAMVNDITWFSGQGCT